MRAAEYSSAVLGILLAVLLAEPMNAAHRTLDNWLRKQRALPQCGEEVADLAIDRDPLPGTDGNLSTDRDPVRRSAFSRLAPAVFVVFWVCVVAFCTVCVWLWT